MKFLRLTTTEPYLNLAVEEHLFRTADEDVFLLWQNDRTVVIGRNQNAHAEINTSFTEANGIRIARRITGGGAVYHDLGNLNYTFIATESGDRSIDFATFSAPILDALASLGVNATLSGRNDLEVDGKKISGCAQHREGDRVLHHGTLLFNTDLNILTKALHVDAEKLRARALGSVRARVQNLKPLLNGLASASELADVIERYVTARYGATAIEPPENAEIDALRLRNASADWLYPAKGLAAQYTAIRKKRYPFGSVEAMLDLEGNRIRSVAIHGDFFGIRPIAELEALLVGKQLSKAARILSACNVSDFILGMTNRELAELILE